MLSVKGTKYDELISRHEIGEIVEVTVVEEMKLKIKRNSVQVLRCKTVSIKEDCSESSSSSSNNKTWE